MRKWLVLLMCLVAGTASAQITIPNTFSPNTTAQSALVNANFSQVGSLALNRSGGNVTGNITADGGVTIDGVDIGATICVTCDPTFDDLTIDTLTAVSAVISSTLNVTGAVTFSSTLSVDSTASNAIDVAGGITAGSGNVAIVDTAGRIPALSSTYFASLSGANLTGIPETAITDGSLLARLAANEVITGSWTVGSGSGGATFTFNGGAASNVGIFFQNASSIVGQLLFFNGDTYLDHPGSLNIRNSAATTTFAQWDSSGNLVQNFGVRFTNIITASALSAGENHNFNPTGLSTAAMIRVAGNAITPSKITGITGGAAGRRILFCNTGTDLWSFKPEDADSTSTNRIAGELTVEYVVDPETCTEVFYDSTSSRWRVVTGASALSPL